MRIKTYSEQVSETVFFPLRGTQVPIGEINGHIIYPLNLYPDIRTCLECDANLYIDLILSWHDVLARQGIYPFYKQQLVSTQLQTIADQIPIFVLFEDIPVRWANKDILSLAGKIAFHNVELLITELQLQS